MNKHILITFFLIIFIYIILPYPINAEDNYIIDGNTVYINDENVYLSAYPHTIYESGYVYFNFSSKSYDGNIDVVFGFNTSLVKPKKAELYNSNTKTWVNFPLSFTLLSYSHQNCDKWFYIKNVPIISNKNYNVRIWMNLPISTNVNNGKYLFAVKPSFETIQQSIDNNRLYVLDPWFNTSFTDRQKIIITTNGSTIPQNYQILLNVTYNSSMQNDFSDLRFTNYSNGELSYWIESKVNSDYAKIWVKLSNEIIHPNNDIIYMYYGNNQVNTISNITKTMIFGDDFNTIIDTVKWNNTDGFLQSGNDVYATGTKYLKSKNNIQIRNTVIEYNLKMMSPMSPHIAGLLFAVQSSSLYYGAYMRTNNINGLTLYKDDAANPIDSGIPLSIDENYHKYTTKSNGTSNLYLYIDDNNEKSISNSIYNTGKIYLMSYAGTGINYWDYIFVRKYITNEPIITYNETEYYTNTLYYNVTSNYNHTIESDGIIIVNRSLIEIDNTYWSAKSLNITYWIFTKEINSSGYTNFTVKKDNLNNFTVKLKQYSYYSLNNSSLINIFNTNQYGIANIDINLIPDDYYIYFINQSLIPPPTKPLYPIHPILIFKDNLCINNINKIIVYKNNSYIGIYNYSDEILYLNNTNYTFFINYDNIDIINSENFLITFFKNYGYILISIISLIILFGICIYFFNKVRR